MSEKQSISLIPLAVRTTLAFWVLAPLCTFGLLAFKGLPSFAADHFLEVFIWVYQVTWVPALASGILLSQVLIQVRPWFPFFIRPYDFGRCYSLGAITGAVLEAFCTWGYRALLHLPYSASWVAGATIAGSLAGALVTTALLGLLSKSRA